jgi:membrane fusion protein (multidrug efflux system)
MSSSQAPVESTAPAPKPEMPSQEANAPAPPESRWKKYITPLLVVLLALAVLITVTGKWNSWEGGKLEQVTDDAYVRGDLTPLSTKVAGIVKSVDVSDYQPVHKGDLLVVLEDSDYQAQVAQASATVEAARAAIEENQREEQLQGAKIDRALAGVEQAKAGIDSAQSHIAAARAVLDRAIPERRRQEALITTGSTTPQKVEQVVADEEGSQAQLAIGQATLQESKAALSSSEAAAEAERRALLVLKSKEAQLAADLHAKEANLVVAQVNLGYTKISAPADGSVGERQVRPGQLVSPGTQIISFVDRTRWVQANYKETQLTNVKAGDEAEIRIDEFPGQVIRGKVIEISPASGSQFALLPPDNSTGNYTKVVQRISVKIGFDDASLAAKLRPGLSVIATVRTKR